MRELHEEVRQLAAAAGLGQIVYRKDPEGHRFATTSLKVPFANHRSHFEIALRDLRHRLRVVALAAIHPDLRDPHAVVRAHAAALTQKLHELRDLQRRLEELQGEIVVARSLLRGAVDRWSTATDGLGPKKHRLVELLRIRPPEVADVALAFEDER